MNTVNKWIFGTFIGFFLMIGVWLSIIYISACGFSVNCQKFTPLVERTPIPTLIPATLPPALPPVIVPTVTPMTVDGTPVADTIARPSNPGGPGPAVDLKGDVASGKQLFVDYCARCHGDEGVGGIPNPGTVDGTVPPLNPIDSTLVSEDYKTFATNVDLFIEHGSTPAGTIPNLDMPAWGDTGAFTPQQIADVIAYVISLNEK